MKNIILESEKHSAQRTGNKAANLARLKNAGFAVPTFVTILPSAFREDGRWQDPLLEEELKQARTILQAEGALLAVRSSALDEDGHTTSFAGQLDSFLNVSAEWVVTAARSVWLSGENKRVAAYRSQMGVKNGSLGPAVIVQRMVDAVLAGVAFSADPVSGERDVVVINAVHGLADRLVSGEQEGLLFYVRNGGRSIARNSDSSEVDDAILKEIAATVSKIEKLFGCPQDVEWAHDGKQLFILQARPITGLPSAASQGRLRIWDNSNIAESYQGVTTPLTFSFAAKAYEHVYIHFCKLMGVRDVCIKANRSIFPNMLGFIRGRVYYNLVNWYRLLALLPGYKVNRPFMEQMMGVKEGLPVEITESVKVGHGSSVLSQAEFLLSLASILIRFCNLTKEIERFQTHFNTTLDTVPDDLSKLSLDELGQLYRGLEESLLSAWDAPLVNDFFAMIFYGLFTSLSQRWFAPEPFCHHELLKHTGGIVSAEPAKLMSRMAALASDDAELISLLSSSNVEKIVTQIESNEKFKTQYNEYIAKFGDRCFNELKLESPTLRDNPLPLFRSVAALAGRRNAENLSDKPCVETARSQIARLPLFKRIIFNFVADQAVERIRWRENLRFERTRLFGVVRRIFVAVGSRMVESQILEDKQDVFFLEVEEILRFLEGKSTTLNLSALAKLRKQESSTFMSEPPLPNRIVTRSSIVEAPSQACDNSHGVEEGTILNGLGCSAGVVRAPVRIVRDPATVSSLNGEILVAERTDPGWIVLFSQARGIIVEYGSLLSHTAIVSRELGIPAVVSASGVINWLKDGDIVELDGKTGNITKIETSSKQTDQKVISEHDSEGNVLRFDEHVESASLRKEAS